MPSWFIGVNRGQLQNPGLVRAGTSTASTDFELRIDTGKGSTKEDTLLAVTTVMQYLQGNFVPSGSPGSNQPQP